MDLIAQALCHPSYAHEHGCGDNQRLEFMGDAVLQLIVTEWLMELYPNANEGILSRIRVSMVNNRALADAARRYGLDQKIRLGKGALRDGVNNNNDVLADCFEAYVGAIFQQDGYNSAVAFVKACIDQEGATACSDHKTALQEFAQARRQRAVYSVVEVTGPCHDQMFKVKVSVGDLSEEGFGKSIKVASQDAARKALCRLT